MSETRPERFLSFTKEQTTLFSALVQERLYFVLNQWRIQDFSEGLPTPEEGVLTYYLA